MNPQLLKLSGKQTELPQAVQNVYMSNASGSTSGPQNNRNVRLRSLQLPKTPKRTEPRFLRTYANIWILLEVELSKTGREQVLRSAVLHFYLCCQELSE